MVIGFTGHRPSKLANQYNYFCQFRKDLRKAVYEVLLAYYKFFDVRQFVCGMALGFDIDCAASVIKLRRELSDNDVRLFPIIPSKKQSSTWNDQDKTIYSYILSHSEKVLDVSELHPTLSFTDLLLLRNKYIVNHSDIILYLWDGVKSGGTYQCLEYAIRNDVNCVPVALTPEIKQPLGWSNHGIDFLER